jgi:hypothetical protein
MACTQDYVLFMLHILSAVQFYFILMPHSIPFFLNLHAGGHLVIVDWTRNPSQRDG